MLTLLLTDLNNCALGICSAVFEPTKNEWHVSQSHENLIVFSSKTTMTSCFARHISCLKQQDSSMRLLVPGCESYPANTELSALGHTPTPVHVVVSEHVSTNDAR